MNGNIGKQSGLLGEYIVLFYNFIGNLDKYEWRMLITGA